MRDKDLKNLPTFYFPNESQEVIQKRKEEVEKKWAIANRYGVDLTLFDGEDVDALIFKTAKEKRQYEADTFMLSILIDKGEPIPDDLAERLLKVKKLREQLKKK